MLDERTVLALGYFQENGARHSAVRQGLHDTGWTVRECSAMQPGFFAKCRSIRRMLKEFGSESSIILIPFQGHHIVPFIWLLTRFSGHRIVFDAFISLYDSMVLDRKRVSRFSPQALLHFAIDFISCHCSNLILLDTPEHRQYFINTFKLRPERVIVVPIGCDRTLFQSQETSEKNDQFTVLFHGTFIPLQGIETIARAAKILQDQKSPVHFSLIGRGQTYEEMVQLSQNLQLQNLAFLGTKTPQEVVAAIQRADCCLGIFGTTPKTDRVIPHKAFEINACRKPLITGDTTAARRYYDHQSTALLSEAGNPAALAECIETLRNDEVLREKIAQNGYELFLRTCEPTTIVAELIPILEQWHKRSSSPA